jgi:class 3 adenylate cyclase/tetratricopeptide (TPR) repeat protein
VAYSLAVAAGVECSRCGGVNEAGRTFCGECGGPLAVACASCGSANTPGTKFCGECGSPLGAAEPAGRPATPVAERRVVSVLFLDLVGFTTASETRDAEDTRELLTRYFELARTTIQRYGGTVEKFIGDAVMALWGAPVAQEDDAERAVRAALELIAAVPALDGGLKARAGVLSGEAAVTLGAEGQGMVAGDLVNTASRIQSTAEPGTVLVGESTKRASEAAVAYDDAGEHLLKGKTEPLQLWRALRVVAGARGSLRSAGLEAPFVGRDRELRLVKDLFHASADEGRAQLVLVNGIAGIGKSRLAWEFEKYVDGLAHDAFWHRGRCLSYGDGVAYWALAEMVRMRCGIVEDEEPESARDKLRLSLSEYILDADERDWVEPRLAHLLGLEEGAPGDQENLFSAWRILFERLAEDSPTVLVFEDVQWADAGLLDFLEYLLDWSRSHPLFVLALARPEFADKRPTWGAGKRSFSSLYLEPLSNDAMHDLLTGLVPGLPDELMRRILDRAEGVPLYAVETVRMLLDRGLLRREGNVYHLVGAVETLDVPETLHLLVAARLDALTTEERRLVEDGAVLGKTFTKQGLAALTGRTEADFEPVLAGLLRKEILSVQADPRSPERGQYAFLQDIVKRVAYETLSLRDRKAKHLAAAEFLLGSAGEEDEFVEVVAAHYLDALHAAPDAPDAGEIRGRARETLVRAAERAGSLAAHAEAQRSFERAAELSENPLEQAQLHERAGVMARNGARVEDSKRCFERAIGLFGEAEAGHAMARVEARLAETMWDLGRIEDGLERMNRSYELMASEVPDEDLGTLAAQVGRFMFFGGQPDLAEQRIEAALEIAEALVLPEVFAQALTTKAIILISRGRREEGLALMRFALETAREHDKPSAAMRASYNLADSLAQGDRFVEAAQTVRDGLAYARRVGNRYWELSFLGQLYGFVVLGAWDEALDFFEQLPLEHWAESRQAFSSGPLFNAVVLANRGRLDEVDELLARFAEMGDSGDEQERSAYRAGVACFQLRRGNPAEALEFARNAFASHVHFGFGAEQIKEAFTAAGEAALALGDVDTLGELLGVVDSLPPGSTNRSIRAQSDRFHARLTETTDAEGSDELYRRSAAILRELGASFRLAVVQTEHAEALLARGAVDDAQPLLVEARETFDGLGAAPWLERLDALPTGVHA